EIKTTLDSVKARDALINIASVRELDIIKENFAVLKPQIGKIGAEIHEPTPPRGIIFSYNSVAKNFETFKGWFTPETTESPVNYPVLIGCLDQGIIKFKNANIFNNVKANPNDFTLEGYFIPVSEENNQPVYLNEPDSYARDGIAYPVKQIESNYCPVDQSRVLLNFLLLLIEVIKKEINPNILFSEHYFDESINLHIKL
ncbi:MAG: hypothetical protein ACK4PR_12040, partial [Gammaproteobacteria bacterium]